MIGGFTMNNPNAKASMSFNVYFHCDYIGTLYPIGYCIENVLFLAT